MNSFRFFSVKQASSHLIVLHDTASTQTRSRSTVFTKDAVYDDQSVISEREITWTDLAKAIGDYLLQSIGGYMSMDMFIKTYDREIKAGAFLRITKRMGFGVHGGLTVQYFLLSLSFLSRLVQMTIIMVIDMCDRPSPAMASKNLKAKASLSPHVFFDDVVPEICIDTLCRLWCMTMAIFLEGFPRVQDPNQRSEVMNWMRDRS
ncbi:hypothetical protein Rs2_31271 [Raphanus sativus]|nr:hypothetical protein Rs2_31271 [Raphanus sativus]